MLSWICDTTECWSATGSMMSGWAAWAGVAAVVIGARKAFDTYKRQKQEDRRIEVAESVLVTAYEVRAAIEGVRGPMHFPAELERAGEDLRSNGVKTEGMDENQLVRLKTAQLVLNRIKDSQPIWNKVPEIMPRAKAVFGDAVEGHLRNELYQMNRVRAAALGYARDEGRVRERTQGYEEAIWDMDDRENPDPKSIGSKVNEAIAALEAILLPVIRSEASPKKLKLIGKS